VPSIWGFTYKNALLNSLEEELPPLRFYLTWLRRLVVASAYGGYQFTHKTLVIICLIYRYIYDISNWRSFYCERVKLWRLDQSVPWCLFFFYNCNVTFSSTFLNHPLLRLLSSSLVSVVALIFSVIKFDFLIYLFYYEIQCSDCRLKHEFQPSIYFFFRDFIHSSFFSKNIKKWEKSKFENEYQLDFFLNWFKIITNSNDNSKHALDPFKVFKAFLVGGLFQGERKGMRALKEIERLASFFILQLG